MDRRRLTLMLLPAALLAGCAGMSGAPQPVSKLAVTQAWPRELDDVVGAYRGIDDEALRKSKRNEVIARYMAAADDQYDRFVADLSQEMHATNVTADVGVLALSGLGAVTKGAANELAAATAFLTGSRASLNKELYLERALPAIITSMDVNRQRVANRIAARRRTADADYSLDDALLDLRDYERAGNINRAFNQLAEAARAAFDAAEQDFPDATEACVAPPALVPLRRATTRYLSALQQRVTTAMPAAGTPDDQALDRIAAAMTQYGMTPAGKATSATDLLAQRAAIRDHLLASCSVEEATSFNSELTGANDG